MTMISLRNGTALVAALALTAGVSGCFRVHTEKDANGDDKNVQVDTPFGGVHVNTNQLSASDLGMPIYPGATLVTDEKNKSADVHLGFGEWQLRVRAVSYKTGDSQDKVLPFYKKAMARYGDVISCQGHTAVGTPTTTSEGLTCADDGDKNVKIDASDMHLSTDGMELKAGSRRHQHIVGFDADGGGTRIGLVALDLPNGLDSSSSSKSD